MSTWVYECVVSWVCCSWVLVCMFSPGLVTCTGQSEWTLEEGLADFSAGPGVNLGHQVGCGQGVLPQASMLLSIFTADTAPSVLNSHSASVPVCAVCAHSVCTYVCMQRARAGCTHVCVQYVCSVCAHVCVTHEGEEWRLTVQDLISSPFLPHLQGQLGIVMTLIKCHLGHRKIPNEETLPSPKLIHKLEYIGPAQVQWLKPAILPLPASGDQGKRISPSVSWRPDWVTQPGKASDHQVAPETRRAGPKFPGRDLHPALGWRMGASWDTQPHPGSPVLAFPGPGVSSLTAHVCRDHSSSPKRNLEQFSHDLMGDGTQAQGPLFVLRV
nr:uncharacterized protein LOC102136179 [Macaca fascicularis]